MTNWAKNLIAICCFPVFLAACGGGQSAKNDISAGASNVEGSGISSATSSTAGAVTLSWLPPTKNTDGSTLTDLSGYKIFYGTSPDALTKRIDLKNAGLTSYVIENLAVGRDYYFAITAINSSDLQSEFSNIANETVNG